jgi:hypothetical protein
MPAIYELPCRSSEVASKSCHYSYSSDHNSAFMAPKDSTMRVAVAGTNELALLMAHYIVSETSYQLVILSRQVCISENLTKTF